MARPRKATALLLLEGGFRRDRHADRAPEPVHPIGGPPSHLPADARRIWREVTAAAGAWLRASDRSALGWFCRLEADARRDFGALPAGRLRALVTVAAHLGLTPADRARMPAAEDAKRDDDSPFFND
jgi:phage terminase small subunit